VASSWFLFFIYHNDARSNKHQIPDTLGLNLLAKVKARNVALHPVAMAVLFTSYVTGSVRSKMRTKLLLREYCCVYRNV